MSEKRKRRSRSEMTVDVAHESVVEFAKLVERFAESSDGVVFGSQCLAPGLLNIQIMVKGDFGVAEDLFEAIRIFKGIKLPAKP